MPMLVAYRDGFTDSTTHQPIAWKTAPASKSVDLMIKGAYSVAVVCQLDNGRILTWQAFHTVDDDKASEKADPSIDTPCQPAPVLTAVSGTLSAPGSVSFGDQVATTGAGNTFTVNIVDGKYDLVATTAEVDPSVHKTLIQRDIAVAANIGTFDFAGGVAQVPLGIALSNPPNPDKSKETVAATVEITTKNNPVAAIISTADFDLMAKKVKVFGLPKSAVGADDQQTATFIGTLTKTTMGDDADTTITTSRSITMPFTVGDDTSTGKATFSLPASISIPAWGMDKSRLSVALPALPALDDITVAATSNAAAVAAGPMYMINITTSYFGATGLARPVFDTDIPGYMPTWKIDFTKPYTRTIKSERDAFSKGVFVDHEQSQFSEVVTPHPAP